MDKQAWFKVSQCPKYKPIADNLNIRKGKYCPATTTTPAVSRSGDSETGWTGELWSNRVLLILENKEDGIFFFAKKNFLKKIVFLKKKGNF